MRFFFYTRAGEKNAELSAIPSLTVLFHCQKLLSQDGMPIVIAEGGVNVGNRIWRNSAGTIRLTRENNLYFLIIFPASSSHLPPFSTGHFRNTNKSVIHSRTRLTRNRVDTFKLFSLENSPLKHNIKRIERFVDNSHFIGLRIIRVQSLSAKTSLFVCPDTDTSS